MIASPNAVICLRSTDTPSPPGMCLLLSSLLCGLSVRMKALDWGVISEKLTAAAGGGKRKDIEG